MKSLLFINSYIISLLIFAISVTSCSTNKIFEHASNVGNPKLKGEMNYNKADGIYTLTGAGTNMWGNSDEFFMVWEKVTGDFTLSAQIDFEGAGVDPHRKMGLIIRESLEGDAVYADVAVHGDGLTSLQYRDSKGDETKEVVSTRKAPDYLVLNRQGNQITIGTDNGKYPTCTDAAITINLPPTCYVGLFICSHNPDVLETGYFSSVKLK